MLSSSSLLGSSASISAYPFLGSDFGFGRSTDEYVGFNG